ncbi:uncharacterized protein LOC120465278 isoform X1 [Pimephales promelas]|uniref:uncharacterized protein LOC120465278 isoform X1 n=1 Tax=Pimephales promelas TaxID=90988 RepID=UPI0019556EDE|nr:uncharacterized protein LOC120465278 isoform X1 [Pimephales promelas]
MHWRIARRMTPLIPKTFLFFSPPHTIFLSLERRHHSLLSAAKSHRHRHNHHHHHLTSSHRVRRPAAPWDGYRTTDERLRPTDIPVLLSPMSEDSAVSHVNTQELTFFWKSKRGVQDDRREPNRIDWHPSPEV